MAETFDAFRYISYMRSRLPWIAASCAAAVLIAFAVSLTLPRQYTATARIIIEPPAGTDPRSAMAVSPIYLESLRTYENFASSDSLFQTALGRFSLRADLGGSIESLKRRVLKVAIVRNTRILEISATLPDPNKAQALASFLADSTVAMNRSMMSDGDQDLIRNIAQQERDTRTKLLQSEEAWARQLAAEPVRDLELTVESAAEMRSAIERQIQSAELDIADAADREKQDEDAPEEIRKARVRLDVLRKQLRALDSQTAEREKLLAVRVAHQEKIEAERKAGATALAAVETRLREARNDAGSRGERLRVIDPGIVPERPSSPNIPLNLAAALLLGVVLPVLYFTLEMSYQEQRARRTVYR